MTVRIVRRLMLMLCTAAVGAAALFAVTAPSALAQGGVGDDTGMWGNITNLTPYTWTIAAVGGYLNRWQTGQVPFPQTVLPGQSFTYENKPYSVNPSIIGVGWYYSDWFSIKVPVLGGETEYLNVINWGCHCTADQASPNNLNTWVYVDSAPPAANYEPADGHFNSNGPVNPAPPAINPQIGWSQSDPIQSDAVFFVVGDYTVDAAKDPAGLSDVLNSLCSGASGTTCKFTPSGPLVWGIGPAVMAASGDNCEPKSPLPVPGGPVDPNPDNENLSYSASETQSLSVGGGVTGKTETTLFEVMKTELDISVEASHQWSQTKSFTRSEAVDIPANSDAYIFVAPTVAKTIGKLVVSVDSAGRTATFTILNFGATRSGIARGTDTPAFDAITTTAPMTAAEYAACVQRGNQATPPRSSPPPRRRHRHRRVAPRPVPVNAGSLFVGRGVARVKLGESNTRVAALLGQPLFKGSGTNDCTVLDPRCRAGADGHVVWSYRRLEVIFGADQRVDALIYTGRETSRQAVGVGTTLAQLRAAYPHAACDQYPYNVDCRVDAPAQPGAATVFHFPLHGACDTVALYTTGDRAARRARSLHR